MVTHMFYRPDGSNAQNRINSITAFLKLIGENEGVTFCFERSPVQMVGLYGLVISRLQTTISSFLHSDTAFTR